MKLGVCVFGASKEKAQKGAGASFFSPVRSSSDQLKLLAYVLYLFALYYCILGLGVKSMERFWCRRRAKEARKRRSIYGKSGMDAKKKKIPHERLYSAMPKAANDHVAGPEVLQIWSTWTELGRREWRWRPMEEIFLYFFFFPRRTGPPVRALFCPPGPF